MKNQKAFTLLELLIVIIIICILAILFIPSYKQAREATLNDEARATLKLISAAERAFFMQNGSYFYSPSEADLNENLKLSLQETAPLRWDYAVTLDPVAPATGTYNATARRNAAMAGSGYERLFWINRTMDEAACIGFCK